jgi:putative methyltransferase (TIGR04325 family)
MGARQTVKALVPPVVVKLIRRGRGLPEIQYIWRGIYNDFGGVPASGPGHASEARLESVKRLTRRAIDKLSKGELRVGSEYSLSSLVISLLKANGRHTSVLDIGGGMGIGYLYLRASLPNLDEIEYRVVEVEPIAIAGAQLFAGNQEISFTTELPSASERGKFDFVQFCGSLQYIDDYKSVIARASEYRPQFIYVLKTPVGDFPTFATAQYNLSDAVAPTWFFNRKMLIDSFTENGYELICQGTHDRVYDTTNFDQAHQMERYSHLLFKSIAGNI